MAVLLALKAKDALVLGIVVHISGQNSIQLLLSDGLFLTVGRLMAHISADMASHFGFGLHARVEAIVLLDGILVLPVFSVGEPGKDLQGGIDISNHWFQMHFVALGTFGAESIDVILAHLLSVVVEVASESLPAETSLIERTVLLPLLIGHHMSVHASLPLLAVSAILAGRNPVFNVDVQEVAVVLLLALVLQPVDTHKLLLLALVYLNVTRLDVRYDLVHTQLLVVHY
jgi:hypothetical protein